MVFDVSIIKQLEVSQLKFIVPIPLNQRSFNDNILARPRHIKHRYRQHLSILLFFFEFLLHYLLLNLIFNPLLLFISNFDSLHMLDTACEIFKGYFEEIDAGEEGVFL